MLRKVAAVVGLVSLIAAGAAPPASARTEYPQLRKLIQRIATVDGAPGALAQVQDGKRRTVVTGGVGDVRTGRPIPRGSHWRVGSITKPFVATVVLQLVGEGKVELDAPVDRYLPGLVDERITVRQILQHTSGLPNYLEFLPMQEIISKPFTHYEPRELLDVALAHPPSFEPGEGWSYSNTGYLVAAMLVEKVTGHAYGAEIQRRILTPLRLRDTSVPGDYPFLPRPHPRGYVRPGPDAELLDRTAFNPSIAFGSGNMVSTASDLNRFFAALVDGRVLRPAELREMTAVLPSGPGAGYGLGLLRTPLPCGGYAWGHDGDVIGFSAISGVVRDGRQATVMADLKPGSTDAQGDDLRAALGAALCE